MNVPIVDGKALAGAKQVARPARAEAEQAVRTLLAFIGEDPGRAGLIDTPARVVAAYGEMFAGYGGDAGQILSRTFAEVGGYDDSVIVRDIAFFSHCEHHMMPFFGSVHIGYLPSGPVVGLSKLARIVDLFARRLQTQENLTAQIVGAIAAELAPRGIAVVVEAEHMCASMRGVGKKGARMVTQKFTDAFADEPARRDQFLQMVFAGAR